MGVKENGASARPAGKPIGTDAGVINLCWRLLDTQSPEIL
jgi:hypothetical protein